MSGPRALVHGTYGGWQAHRKRGEEPCTSCVEARAQYTRNYRAGDATRRRRDRWWNNTRSEAREALVREYPERFAEILADIRSTTPSEW